MSPVKQTLRLAMTQCISRGLLVQIYGVDRVLPKFVASSLQTSSSKRLHQLHPQVLCRFVVSRVAS